MEVVGAGDAGVEVAGAGEAGVEVAGAGDAGVEVAGPGEAGVEVARYGYGVAGDARVGVAGAEDSEDDRLLGVSARLFSPLEQEAGVCVKCSEGGSGTTHRRCRGEPGGTLTTRATDSTHPATHRGIGGRVGARIRRLRPEVQGDHGEGAHDGLHEDGQRLGSATLVAVGPGTNTLYGARWGHGRLVIHVSNLFKSH